MGSLNKVMLIGRLTRDPESRTFTNGGKVTQFGFAVTGNRTKDNQTGQWKEEPCFLDCKCFDSPGQGRQLATLAENSLHKGKEVYLEGKLVMESWNDKTSGEKRTVLRVIVLDIVFVGPRDDNASGGNRNNNNNSNQNDGGGGWDDGGNNNGGGDGGGFDDGIPF